MIGIVASRIVERHHRPAILIALDGDGRGTRLGAQHPGLRPARRAARGAGAPRALRRPPRRRRADDRRCPASTRFRAAIEAHAERGADARAAAAGRARRRGRLRRRARPRPGRGARARSSRAAIGNPGPRLLVPGARFDDVRPMGEGRHAALLGQLGRRARPRGRVRLRRPARREPRRARSTRASGSSATSGTARSSRGWCSRHAQPCAPAADRACSASRDELPARRSLIELEASADRSLAAPAPRGRPSPEPAPAACARCSTAAARARWRCSPTRSPAGEPGAGGLRRRRSRGCRPAARGRRLRADLPPRRSSATRRLADPFAHVVVLDPPSAHARRRRCFAQERVHPFGMGRG